MSSKSANQLWRESGTSLSFKDWITREKNKGIFIKNKKLENVVKEFNADGKESDKSLKISDTGLPMWAIYTGATILAVTIAYHVIKHSKKSK